MSLKNADFPSSAAFEQINGALKGDAKEREQAIKSANAVFAFQLKNSSGVQDAWHIDLKDKGVVGKGAAPAGGKADVTLSLSDKDFGDLVSGKSGAQQLFMSGKLKIKGNMMKATKLQSVFASVQDPKAKL